MTHVFAISYGDAGVGKSTDAAAAYPTALFICRPGGMRSASTFLGLPEAQVRTRTVRSLIDVLTLLPQVKAAGYPAVVVDDVSLLAESLDTDLQQRYPGNKQNGVRYGELRVAVGTYREQARFADVDVVMNAHPKPAGRDSKGIWHRGGPKLPAWSITDSLPFDADIVLRADVDPMRPEQWQSVYRFGEPEWISKDSFFTAAPTSPMNLRALLVGRGAVLPRWPGLEWQDDVMAQVAEAVVARVLVGTAASAARQDIARRAFTKLAALGLQPAHIAWAIRDGLALGEIRQLRETAYERLFDVRVVAPPPMSVALGGDTANDGSAANGGLVVDVANAANGGTAANGVTNAASGGTAADGGNGGLVVQPLSPSTVGPFGVGVSTSSAPTSMSKAVLL